MARAIPKVSGLIKVGALVPASLEETAGLPDFEVGEKNVSMADTESILPIAPTSEMPIITETKVATDAAFCFIPLSKLKIHPFNSRVLRTQNRIEEIREMLETDGIQREPITVVPSQNPEEAGCFYILSGQTRYHAANLAGWSELKAQINTAIDPDDHLQFFSASIEHNATRPETDWDLAVKAKQLLDEGIEAAKIQKAVRRDERGFRRLMAMSNLPEPIQAVVRDHAVKLSAVFCETLKSAAPHLEENDIAGIAKQTVEKDLSRRALEEAIHRAVRLKKRDSGLLPKRAIREFILPIIIEENKKAGELKVMTSSKTEGCRVINLTVDLPENLVEAFKADIENAIVKLKNKSQKS